MKQAAKKIAKALTNKVNEKNILKVTYEYEKTPDSEERLREIFEYLLKPDTEKAIWKKK